MYKIKKIIYFRKCAILLLLILLRVNLALKLVV